MNRILTAGIFLSVAVGAHVALAAMILRSGAEGASAAGDGGEAVLTLQASTVAMAEMVAQWQRPMAEPIDALRTQLAVPKLAPVDAHVALPKTDPMPELAVLPVLSAQPEEERFSAPDAPNIPPQLSEPKPEPKPEPKAKAAQSQSAQQGSDHSSQKTRAAGAGGGDAAGQSRSATTGGSLSKAARQSAMATWGAAINHSIARKKHAVRGQGGGVVQLVVSISDKGKLLAVRVTRSSGNPALDAAAVEAVKRVGRFSAAPKGLVGPRFDFSQSIRFK